MAPEQRVVAGPADERGQSRKAVEQAGKISPFDAGLNAAQRQRRRAAVGSRQRSQRRRHGVPALPLLAGQQARAAVEQPIAIQAECVPAAAGREFGGPDHLGRQPLEVGGDFHPQVAGGLGEGPPLPDVQGALEPTHLLAPRNPGIGPRQPDCRRQKSPGGKFAREPADHPGLPGHERRQPPRALGNLQCRVQSRLVRRLEQQGAPTGSRPSARSARQRRTAPSRTASRSISWASPTSSAVLRRSAGRRRISAASSLRQRPSARPMLCSRCGLSSPSQTGSPSSPGVGASARLGARS